jgi:tRNA modification GTPase
VVRELISLDGLPVHVADTAGIRETCDRVEVEGVRRAREALKTADLVLLVLDLTQPLEPQLALGEEAPQGVPVLRLFNKVDLLTAMPDEAQEEDSILLSVTQGRGLDLLVARVRAMAGLPVTAGSGTFSARSRHLEALRRAREHLAAGRDQLSSGFAETLAEELRLAQQALGEITGEFLPDDLLGAIFSSFCIGK